VSAFRSAGARRSSVRCAGCAELALAETPPNRFPDTIRALWLEPIGADIATGLRPCGKKNVRINDDSEDLKLSETPILTPLIKL